MEQFKKSFKKFRMVWIVVLVVSAVIWLSKLDIQKKKGLVYKESLDEVVATVEDTDITLRDFAVYVAYQEQEVDASAKIYDKENPQKYWGLHTNGTFIKFQARNEAMSMAIHDRLFYLLSKELDISLTEEEHNIVKNNTMDFWSDLLDDEKQLVLGIFYEDVQRTMEQIALAEKCQHIYAEMDGLQMEDYDFAGEEYQEFSKDYKIKVYDQVLEQLNFGRITLNY